MLLTEPNLALDKNKDVHKENTRFLYPTLGLSMTNKKPECKVKFVTLRLQFSEEAASVRLCPPVLLMTKWLFLSPRG